MTPAGILADLYALGAHVRVDGDKLKISAPAGSITPEIKAALAEHKPAIIETLTRPRPGDPTRPIPVRFRAGHPPAFCLMDKCDGDLTARDNLFICDLCGCWYEGIVGMIH